MEERNLKWGGLPTARRNGPTARRNGTQPIAAFIYFSLYFFYFLQKSGGDLAPPAKKVGGPRPPCSSIYAYGDRLELLDYQCFKAKQLQDQLTTRLQSVKDFGLLLTAPLKVIKQM